MYTAVAAVIEYEIILYYIIRPRCVYEVVVVNVQRGLFSFSVRESWTRYYNNNNFAQIGHRCNLGGRRVYTMKTYLLLLLLMIISTLACPLNPHYHFADDEGRDLKYTTRSCSNTSESEPKLPYIYICMSVVHRLMGPNSQTYIVHRDFRFYVIPIFLTKHENIIFSYGISETTYIPKIPTYSKYCEVWYS